jgi:hypothetical protein
MEQNSWGWELLLDVKGGDRSVVMSEDKIRQFNSTLIQRIDMNAYGEPQLVHFGKHDPKLAGFTLVQLIETSSITAHFVDHSGDFYLNVHSCKSFDPKVVIDLVREFFKPENIKERFVLRLA